MGSSISVSSSVYNLAGDVAKRANFLKTTVIGAVLNEADIPQTLTDSYLRGPGIKLKSFARWSRTQGYTNVVGLTTGSFSTAQRLNTQTISEQLPAVAGKTISIQKAVLGQSDFVRWADQYMLQNFPDEAQSNWLADYDQPANLITIRRTNGAIVVFSPAGFEMGRNYLYVEYSYGKIGEAFGNNQLLIYAQGWGNAVLDTMFSGGGSMGAFFPYIPMRIDNTFVSPSYYSEVYAASVRAFKKAVGGDYDKVIETIAANPQLGDIDYTYVVFGVSLITKEKEAMRYLYTFFQVCASQSTGGMTFAAWMLYIEDREAKLVAYNTRVAAESSPFYDFNQNLYFDPIRGIWDVRPYPVVPAYVAPPSFTLNISSGNNPAMNYNIALTWAGMSLATGTGLAKAGAKVGELWFEQLADVTYINHTTTMRMEEGQIYYDPIDEVISLERINLVFQESRNRWRRVTILGLVHNNLIYSGRSVTITGKQALNDPEESGFIIPLHEQIYADTPLVSRTQMATSCCYLMFNSYQVVKKKWYQSGIFGVLLVIVIIVVAINYPPAAAALSGGGGILGGNIAVGTALGFAGLAAVVAGVAANAIAAVILMKVIGAGATALFGEKLGQIIGFIASVVAMQAGSMYAAGKEITMSSLYSTMMKAENLLKLTLSTGDAVSNYIRAGTMEILADIKEVQDNYKKTSDEIAQAYENEFGIGNGGVIDPMQLTDIGSVMYEPSQTFLTRTLMTGTDIAEVSLGMITNFAKLTLNLEVET